MLTSKISPFILALALIFIPLYPKFPLLGVPGSFVSIRFEDLLIACIFILFLFTQLKTKFQSLSAPLPRSLLLYLAIGFIAAFSGIFLTKTSFLILVFLHSLRRVEYAVLFLWRKYHSLKREFDIIVVGYSDSRFMIPFVRLISHRLFSGQAGKKIVWDALYSLYDSWVLDRRLVGSGSLKAKYYWFLDWFSCKLADLILLD